MMHLIIRMFNTLVIPYISLDQYLNPNLYTVPNMQNMRFFCCSVYLDMTISRYNFGDLDLIFKVTLEKMLNLGQNT